MAIHFTHEEFNQRKVNALEKMKQAELDGLLMFRQESMYYLTGYDTFGFVFFQCLFLDSNGNYTLLTRMPDLRQAQHTSIIEDIQIWTDQDGSNPAMDLRNILDGAGYQNKRLGVEYNAYGLTAANGKMLDSTLEGFCELIDASNLINELRLIKSPAELDYVHTAAQLADKAWLKAKSMIAPGVSEADILAAMQAEILAGDGDYPANEFIIGSGQDALLCRYFSGRRTLSEIDQLTLEFAGVFRHYHAAMMRTVPIGEVTEQHQKMYTVTIDAMNACMQALKPGNRVGDVFDAYARVCDAGGMKAHRMNATGYSQGTTFAPNWMDWPMFYSGNPVVIEPGMVFFLHMILMDSDSGNAMCPGYTVKVTESGCETLSSESLDLFSV